MKIAKKSNYKFFSILFSAFIICILTGFNNQANDTGKFTIHKSTGCFDVNYSNSTRVWLKDVYATFVCNGKNYSTKDLVTESVSVKDAGNTFGQGKTWIWKFSSKSDKLVFGLELTSYSDNDWVSVNGFVENHGPDKITLNAVHLLEIDDGSILDGDWKKYRVLCGSTNKLVWAGKALDQDEQLSAREVMGLWNSENDSGAVIGFSIKHAWGTVILSRATKGTRLSADVDMDVDIAPKGSVYAEAVHLALGSVEGLMDDLLTHTGAEVGAKTDGPSFAGWCSWYGFNPFIDNDVTEDAVTGFAKTAAKYKEELPLQVMLLDDGYFTLPGDWTTLKPFFPHGMKYLVDKVGKRGLRPGIWIAPSLVHRDSKIIKKHPEWVNKNKKGDPRDTLYNWGGMTYSFDISNPTVLNHIDSLFKVVCGEWGYQYLKLDFNMMPGANRYNRSITSFQAMRNMYKVIRRAAGNDVFIANCAGAPYPPSIGIAQAGRVGPDVNPNWESVIQGCRSSILHIPFHRRWWVNDPDCVNMRIRGSHLTESELEAHITANYMGGGYIMFSDSLDRLPENRRRLLAQAVPPYGQAAQVIDYMTAPAPGIPRILNLPIKKADEQKYTITAVFNWADIPADIQLKLNKLGLDPAKEYYVFDFWTDSYKGKIKDVFTIRAQKPHSCELLSIRPVIQGQIQVVSTNLQLLQGTMEITGMSRRNTSPFDKAKAELCIKIKPVSLRNGKIIVTGGDGLRIAAFQGGHGNLVRRADGLWDLNVNDLQHEAAVLLRER